MQAQEKKKRKEPGARSAHCGAHAMLLSYDALYLPGLLCQASGDSTPYCVASARSETATDITRVSMIRPHKWSR